MKANRTHPNKVGAVGYACAFAKGAHLTGDTVMRILGLIAVVGAVAMLGSLSLLKESAALAVFIPALLRR